MVFSLTSDSNSKFRTLVTTIAHIPSYRSTMCASFLLLWLVNENFSIIQNPMIALGKPFCVKLKLIFMFLSSSLPSANRVWPGEDWHLWLEVQHASKALHPWQQHRQMVLESRGVVWWGAEGPATAVCYRLLQSPTAGLQGSPGYLSVSVCAHSFYCSLREFLVKFWTTAFVLILKWNGHLTLHLTTDYALYAVEILQLDYKRSQHLDGN